MNTLVAGAGPAGLSAAIGLLQRGHSVTVLEQRSAWQGRVCGAFLDSEAVDHLKWLGVYERIIDEAVQVPQMVVTSGKAQTAVSIAHTNNLPLGISRKRLEEILLVQAQREGAEVKMATRYRPGVNNGADLVVLASGRFALGHHPSRADSNGWYGWNAAFEKVNQKPGDMSLHFYPSGYVGVLTFSDGQTNVCGLIRKRSIEMPAWEQVFQEARNLSRHFDRVISPGIRVSPWRGVGPLPFSRSMRRGEKYFLVGDAAAVGDPFMGEGNGRALGAGPMIFETLGEETRLPDVVGMVQRYEQMWNRFYARRLRWGFWTRDMVDSPVLLQVFSRLVLKNPALLERLTPHFHTGYPPPPTPNFCKSTAP